MALKEEEEEEQQQLGGKGGCSPHPGPAAPGGRGRWNRRLEFTLACVGYAVGLGNVWRFPYLCYRSGGGAFLLPYLIMLLLCGIPLLFMEFVIGQYTQFGPVLALAKICPLLKGVGVATVVISFLLCTYYNVIITWALYYFFNSFRWSLPWQSCNNTWNVVENCSDGFSGNATHLRSNSQQFFDLTRVLLYMTLFLRYSYRLLQISSGIDQMGKMRWELFGLLIVSWIIVYFCIFKGVKSTGKVVYFTAIFPYIILIILFSNNVQLPGAMKGIHFFLTPKWGKLLEVQVWVNAAAQVFNSIGIGFGSMISMASYNKFNNNILRDTLIVALTNSATSIFAGFVVFSAIGYMAHQHHMPVEDIATDGPGLVFVVYPEAFVTMPIAPMWATLFFFMLLCLGVDSQVKNYYLQKRTCLRVFACGSVAGVRRISSNVQEMLGSPPNIFFKACWWFAAPLLVTIILVSSIIQYTPAKYGKTYVYPPWAEVLGWCVSLCSIIWIPLGAVHTLYNGKGTLIERLHSSITPVADVLSVENEDLMLKAKSDMSNSMYSGVVVECVRLSEETRGP
uniref:Transporter n=1 Tax=Callorhinchus milii TaxID=7868 RepID=A0A4W3JGP9_CALMI